MGFTNPTYLKTGTESQRLAYHALHKLGIFTALAPYHPVLTGTLPININIAGSDLDILCEVYQPDDFIDHVKVHFGHLPGFAVTQSVVQELPSVIIHFYHQGWPFELFGQPLPAIKQVAYLHMVTEHRILQQASPHFQSMIRQLKQKGIKTEPAFAHLLRLSANPYEAILSLGSFSDDQLHRLLTKNGQGT